MADHRKIRGFDTLAGAALALGVVIGGAAEADSFFAEGSDTIMAMGARHIAMGGTGAATADDPHAIFYNPALLAGIDQWIVTGTRQLDAELRPYSFIGVTVPLRFLEPLGFDATLGVARYNRVHARSTGAFGAGDPESIFLRYLLPGIQGVFDGEIDSKTLVNRFALGVSPHGLPGLSLGVNIDWIDCKTETCGIHAGSAGVETRSIGATALSYGFGASYRFGDRLTLAASISDVDTVLDVHTVLIDNTGTRDFDFSANLPRKMNLEVAFQATDDLLLALGYQRFWGDYGNYSLDFQTVHLGGEYRFWDNLTLRGGVWAPVKMEASNNLNLTLPVPMAPTAGVGWEYGNFEADLAAYFHPLMSYSKGGPSMSAELTLSYKF